MVCVQVVVHGVCTAISDVCIGSSSECTDI